MKGCRNWLIAISTAVGALATVVVAILALVDHSSLFQILVQIHDLLAKIVATLVK